MENPVSPFEQRVSRAWVSLKTYPTLLLDRPHSDRKRALEGAKRRGQITWLLEHGGVTGKTRACKEIECAVRKITEPFFPIPTTVKGASDEICN